jgi:formylglycine-generating enzyme required for sulfatase activity
MNLSSVLTIVRFKPAMTNAYGLFDREGTVWECYSDYYRPDNYRTDEKNNPKGLLTVLILMNLCC